jgi:hypothetical protein
MSVPAKGSSRKSDSEQRHENLEEIINDTFMAVWRNANDFRFALQAQAGSPRF